MKCEYCNKEQEKITEQPNSCEISINAKGQYSGKVKVYADTINLAVEQAVIKAEQMEKLIASKNN